ncbi:MAG: hypothetical protein EOP51_03745 [Sphingobacteriales bacterium]|nr:MAG: hypothetical protein EOP51_03745 [Sphingobacteriales bacterium]
MLKQTFIELLKKYSADNNLTDVLWAEIEENYTAKDRHYHTLAHLENLLDQLVTIDEKINNWEATLFALYYHDIVYDTLRSDNEEKSAELAVQRMKQIAVSHVTIDHCKKQILATKSHSESTESDINLFTDADLSMLGQTWESYENYYKNIRREYAIYPDVVYNEGRKKILQHFLSMPRIFKTDSFYSKYEMQARQNLQKEIEVY